MKLYDTTEQEVHEGTPSSLERRIVRDKLDKIQAAAAIVQSFGYDVSDIQETVRDINEAMMEAA